MDTYDPRALNDAARENAERALTLSVRRNLAIWHLTRVQPAPQVSTRPQSDRPSLGTFSVPANTAYRQVTTQTRKIAIVREPTHFTTGQPASWHVSGAKSNGNSQYTITAYGLSRSAL